MVRPTRVLLFVSTSLTSVVLLLGLATDGPTISADTGDGDTKPQPTQNAAKETADNPKVVEVFPSDGATDVNPLTELRIRFDRPMTPSLAHLHWTHRGPGGFRHRGSLRYDPEKYEFVLPMRLTPDFTHQLTVNEKDDRSGFRSVDGIPPLAFSWSFKTSSIPKPRDGQPPRIVAIEPANDTEVPLYNVVKIRFDRPMNADWYGIKYDAVRPLEKPQLHGAVNYDAARQQFELPLVLPANWNGELQLVDFASAEGVPLDPVTLKYRTLRSPFSTDFKQTIEDQGKSKQLAELLAKIAAQSQKVKSVTETIQLSQTRGEAGWLNHFQTWEARFVKHENRFFGDVSQGMRQTWQIGGDGAQCWFRRQDALVECPAADLAEQNVILCDPFAAGQAKDLDQLIRDFQLEYLGEVELEGRRSHKLRSWSDVERWWSRTQRIGHPTDWYFDAETLMLSQLQSDTSRARFRYAKLNEQIPVEQFRPPMDVGVPKQKPDPLNADYTQLFLSVTDGSHGAMLLRWGRRGPKGTNSSGMSWNW